MPPPDKPATPATNGTNGVSNGTNGAIAAAPTAEAPKGDGFVNGFPKAGDGEWSRTGWEPRFGNLNDALGITQGEGISDHQTWVEGQLDEKFYGGNTPLPDWLNAAAHESQNGGTTPVLSHSLVSARGFSQRSEWAWDG
jgi:hypothetical protein